MSLVRCPIPARRRWGAARVIDWYLDDDRRWRHDEEERGHSAGVVYEYLPSRYGMNPRDFAVRDAIETVVGQGAKPGGGGMLLGDKISGPRRRDAHAAKGIDQRLGLAPSGLDRSCNDLEIRSSNCASTHRLGKPIRTPRSVCASLLRYRARR